MTKGFLSGYKTITTAIAGVIAAWLSYAIDSPVLGVDPPTLEGALNITWFAAVAIFLRQGIKAESSKAKAGG